MSMSILLQLRTFAHSFRMLTLLMLLAMLSACSSHVLKTANHIPIEKETTEIPEDQLLDVGVTLFNPGLEDAAETANHIPVFPEIRKAESRYMAVQLVDTLQTSAAWGAVRVVPSANSAIDVVVKSRIIHSDGESLKVEVVVNDSSGRHWYTKQYAFLASRYAYDTKLGRQPDPFQSIYNNIANDLRTYRNQMKRKQIINIRQISELKFAQNFSPEAFGGHLDQDKKGQYSIKRLPAEGDPMLDRVRNIRERDYLFVDTLQDYYGTFVRDMSAPYQEWRSQTYHEVIAVRELKSTARASTIAGIASIIGGIAAAGSSNRSTRSAGTLAVGGGAYLIKSGFDKRSESQIHVEALQELGDSLEAEIEPQVIELEDRTITLTGSVENQYEQWRDILRRIYELDTGTVSNNSNNTQ